MYTASDLPLLITASVLEYATTVPLRLMPARWKHTLPLLGVCRQWRAIASGMVYKTMYICEDTEEDEDRGVEYSVISTNAHIAAVTSGRDYVKQLFIESDCVNSLELLSKAFPELVGHGSGKWGSIDSLNINIPAKIDSIGARLPETYNEQLKDKASSLTSYIAHYMPNITHLKITCEYNAYIGGVIGSKILPLFEGQLKSVFLNQTVDMSFVTSLNSLTTVKLYVSPSTVRLLASLNISQLIELKLSEIPVDFTWGWFSNDTHNRSIEFLSLKTLNFMCDYKALPAQEHGADNILTKDDSDDACKYTVSFPNLRTITIKPGSSKSLLSSKYIFPRKLDTFGLYYTYQATFLMENIVIPPADNLWVILYNVNEEHQRSMYRMTNSLFSAKKGFRNTKLYLDYQSNITFQDVGWNNLHTVIFPNYCSNAVMVKCLESLPALTKFSATALLMDTVTNIKYTDESEEQAITNKLKPLSKSLIELEVLVLESGEHTDPPIKHYFVNLLAQLPSLVYFNVLYGECIKVLHFEAPYTTLYPHLHKIKFDKRRL